MNTKKDINFPIGFTAIDNRLFYTQEVLSPNAFAMLIRIYRMSNGYDGKPKSLSSTFFQKYCNISKNTVTKVVRELESKGFIITQKRSRSNTLYSIDMNNINKQYLSIVNESQDLYEVGTNDVNQLAQEMCSNKQNILKQNNTKENINIPFSDFWTKYDYCKGKKSDVEAKWIALSNEERTLTMESLDKYLLSTPDKTYRKYPMSYLNTEAWNDEIILIDSKPTDNQNNAQSSLSNRNNANSSNSYSGNAYSASFKLFEDNIGNHIKDDLESNLEALGYCSDTTTDIKKTTDSTIDNKDIAQLNDVVPKHLHWSELKAKGLLKTKVNPNAVAPNTDTDKMINDFLARNSSSRFKDKICA